MRILARRVRDPNAEELAWAQYVLDTQPPLTANDIKRTHELDAQFGWSKRYSK